MPNDRLWIHWLTLGIAGGAAVLVGLFTPDIGTLRLALPLFGAVLLTIGIAGAYDIGGGSAGGGGGVEREGREARAERGREQRGERSQKSRTDGPPEDAGS